MHIQVEISISHASLEKVFSISFFFLPLSSPLQTPFPSSLPLQTPLASINFLMFVFLLFFLHGHIVTYIYIYISYTYAYIYRILF